MSSLIPIIDRSNLGMIKPVHWLIAIVELDNPLTQTHQVHTHLETVSKNESSWRIIFIECHLFDRRKTRSKHLLNPAGHCGQHSRNWTAAK